MSTDGAHLRVPDSVCRFDDFCLSDAQWNALMIPIGLAFFTRSGSDGRITAMYPGPAGAVESRIDGDAWQSIAVENPCVEALRDDVEALLVFRVGDRQRCYGLPIDRCYALTGLLRKQWRGLSGGTTAWASIEQFFADLDRCARDLAVGSSDA